MIGVSLWALERAYKETDGKFLFPRYCTVSGTLSNSASAALNKWVQLMINSDLVVHSLRHAFRDRLRAVECPSDIIDVLGGWTRNGIGESYGNGYDLGSLERWLSRLTQNG